MGKSKRNSLIKLICTNCGAETQKRKTGSTFSKNDLACSKCFHGESLVEKNKK